jgi:hypothetical protein
MKRRVKIQGQTAIYPWRFDDKATFTREETLAGILRDAKSEHGQYWCLSPVARKLISAQTENVRVVDHKNNGRVQYFSVYVPKKLLKALQHAYEDKNLYEEYLYYEKSEEENHEM